MDSEDSSGGAGLPSGGLPAKIAGKYRAIRTIAAGGMGIVYEVEHSNTGERLALKVLRGGVAELDPESLERFRREARVFSLVKSEHIVRVLDADTAVELGGAPFLVMELLDGANLGDATGEEPQPPERVVEWLGQVARALDRAHALGVVHRDLKPENLFLARRTDGPPLVKILDFGIAKVRDEEDRRRTASGTILGTPLYMAPEQAAGEHDKIGPATDQWSMALIAFRLLSGAEYWTMPNVAMLLAQLVFQPMKPPSSRGDDRGPAFDAWFLRSCDRDPSKRWPSVRQQVDALAEALGVPAPLSSDVSLGETLPASLRISAPPSSSPPRAAPRPGASTASVSGAVTNATGATTERPRPTALVVGIVVAALVGVVVLASRGGAGDAATSGAAASGAAAPSAPREPASEAREPASAAPSAASSAPAGSEPSAAPVRAEPPRPLERETALRPGAGTSRATAAANAARPKAPPERTKPATLPTTPAADPLADPR